MPLAVLGPILIGAAGTSAAATTAAWAAIGTGATIAANVYGAKKQASGQQAAAQLTSDTAKETARIQADASAKATAAQTSANEAALAFTKQQALYGAQSSETDRSANYDQWAARERRLGSIGEMVGLGQREIPAYVPSPTPDFGTSGSGGASGGPAASGSAAALKTLIDQGMNPQAAVAKFNQQFGRTTGNEAVYYDPSQHGGKATIGLPDAYLSLEPNGWGITPRSGAPAAAPTTAKVNPYQSVGNYLTAPNARSVAVPMAPAMARPDPYQMRSVGSYL